MDNNDYFFTIHNPSHIILMKKIKVSAKEKEVIHNGKESTSYLNRLSQDRQWLLMSITNHINFFNHYFEKKRKKKEANNTADNEYIERLKEFSNLVTTDKYSIDLFVKSGLLEKIKSREFNKALTVAITNKINKTIMSNFYKKSDNFFKTLNDELGSRKKTGDTIFVIANGARKKEKKIPNIDSPRFFTWLGTRSQLIRIIKASIDNDLFDIDLYSDMDKLINAHFKIIEEKSNNLSEGKKIPWKQKSLVLLTYFFDTLLYDYKLLSITHKTNMPDVIYVNFSDKLGKDFNLSSLRTSRYNYTKNKKIGKPKGFEIIDTVLLGIPKKQNITHHQQN